MNDVVRGALLYERFHRIAMLSRQHGCCHRTLFQHLFTIVQLDAKVYTIFTLTQIHALLKGQYGESRSTSSLRQKNGNFRKQNKYTSFKACNPSLSNKKRVSYIRISSGSFISFFYRSLGKHNPTYVIGTIV